jgi:alpha-ketoglutarate-dependent taurine dioxygenase
MRFEYTLKEGDAVLFDNRRVLHARTAFADRERADTGQEREANRWLKGCYFEADAVLDRGRVLRTKVEQIFS